MSSIRQSLSLLYAALEVIESRSESADPGVQAAFLALREATSAYEAAVVAAHGEIVPVEPQAPPENDASADRSHGPRVSVISRWDFTVLDREKLIAEAEALMGEEIGDAATSVTLLAHVGARNGLAAGANARDAGLFWHGTITMAMPCAITELGDSWVDTHARPFAAVDPDDSLCFITDALDATAVPGVHTFD